MTVTKRVGLTPAQGDEANGARTVTSSPAPRSVIGVRTRSVAPFGRRPAGRTVWKRSPANVERISSISQVPQGSASPISCQPTNSGPDFGVNAPCTRSMAALMVRRAL